MKTIHVIPHTHWDREWYFTAERAKVYFMNDFLRVMEVLEANPDFKCFVVDGQTSLLDDYIELRPQDKSRIQSLVEAGRVVLGPWYTQSDQMLISGESIVRNLHYGMREALTYGAYQHVGYVPDSFGQSSSMPQIYKEFGIHDTLFWRGSTNEMSAYNEFWWEGADGSRVLAIQIPNGYYIGGNIPEKGKAAADFWQKVAIETAGARAKTSHIYLPNGFDQAPIRENLPQLIAEQNARDPENHYMIDSIEGYIASVRNEARNEAEDFETITGELVFPKHSRIHKSIYSSRSDIKSINTYAQHYLVNILEPTLVLADSLGFEYPHRLVEKIWKLMLQNAAHDSIGCCVSDKANRSIKNRYFELLELAENTVELYMRKISTHIACDKGMNIVLFNHEAKNSSRAVYYEGFVPYKHFSILDPSGHEVEYSILEEKDMTNYVLSNRIQLDPSRDVEAPCYIRRCKLIIWAEGIPALGYASYHIVEAKEDTCCNRPVLTSSKSDDAKESVCLSHDSSASAQIPAQISDSVDEQYNPQCVQKHNPESSSSIENAYYRVCINEHGTFDITNKLSGKTYYNQAIIVENGDDGDSFDYSPPEHDLLISSSDCPFSWNMRKSDLYQELCVDYEFDLPYDLDARARGERGVLQKTQLSIVLLRGDDVIHFRFHTDNKVLDHRMTVNFDTTIASAVSIADHQFGVIERPVYYSQEMASYLDHAQASFSLDKLDLKDIPLANQVQNANGWQQPTVAISPTQSFCALAKEGETVAVYPQGVREYEIIGEEYSTIALTLFRTYGYMGKENLLYRPGRASGEKTIATPDAELLGSLDFEFAASYSAVSFDEAHIAGRARTLNTPISCYSHAEFLNGRLRFAMTPVKSDLEATYSLLHLEGDAVFSSLTKSEDEESYLLRVYNGKQKSLSKAELWYAGKKQTAQVNLLGAIKEHSISELKPNQFITFKLMKGDQR